MNNCCTSAFTLSYVNCSVCVANYKSDFSWSFYNACSTRHPRDVRPREPVCGGSRLSPDPHFCRLPNTDIFAGQTTQRASTSIPTSTPIDVTTYYRYPIYWCSSNSTAPMQPTDASVSIPLSFSLMQVLASSVEVGQPVSQRMFRLLALLKAVVLPLLFHSYLLTLA